MIPRGITPGGIVQFDAYPSLANGLYAYLNAGASRSSIFPDYRVGTLSTRVFRGARSQKLGPVPSRRGWDVFLRGLVYRIPRRLYGHGRHVHSPSENGTSVSRHFRLGERPAPAMALRAPWRLLPVRQKGGPPVLFSPSAVEISHGAAILMARRGPFSSRPAFIPRSREPSRSDGGLSKDVARARKAARFLLRSCYTARHPFPAPRSYVPV
jgi:hypothetical protein